VTKVLYVEHNDDNLYMLKTRLELRGGFEVLAAEDSDNVRADEKGIGSLAHEAHIGRIDLANRAGVEDVHL
jgi:CheY-like chemotaxis protein